MSGRRTYEICRVSVARGTSTRMASGFPTKAEAEYVIKNVLRPKDADPDHKYCAIKS
jgi:hypothetical protein